MGTCEGSADISLEMLTPLLLRSVRRWHRTPQMAEVIARALESDISCVNVKATTTEQLGFTGRGEGIAAQSVVLLIGV